jgi:hypothetical protein
MSSYIVESDFVHKGLKCVVVFGRFGHRCGYVGIGKEHILYGKDYNSIIPKELMGKWDEVKQEPIGKRGAIDVICCDLEKPRVGILFDVHGGITYSGGANDYPVDNNDLWFFGFDCGHYQDKLDIQAMEKYNLPVNPYAPHTVGTVKTIKYVERECKKLAEQLIKMEGKQ